MHQNPLIRVLIAKNLIQSIFNSLTQTRVMVDFLKMLDSDDKDLWNHKHPHIVLVNPLTTHHGVRFRQLCQ